MVALITLLFLSCANASQEVKNVQQNKKQQVRVTYYWPGDSGQVSSKTSTGERARHLQTCAVDPKVFKYGSEIHIPELNKTLKANDTGTAVRSRKAARSQGKNVPVIDIFVSNRYEAKRLIETKPMFMDVYIVDDDG